MAPLYDDFGRDISGTSSAAAERERAAAAERARAAAAAGGARKAWELPIEREAPLGVSGAASSAANPDPDDPEAVMTAMLGFGSFSSTAGCHVEDNSKSAARGAVRKVVKKVYRQVRPAFIYFRNSACENDHSPYLPSPLRDHNHPSST